MNISRTIVPLALLLSGGVLSAQQAHLGAWHVFTDMKQVTGVAVSGGTVWASTNGGIFCVDTVSGQISRFTTAEGLASLDLRAVAVDAANEVWTGAGDGTVNVFDGGWRTIADIRESNRVNKAIHGFTPSGDTVLIVSDFGVSVFRRSRWEFADTYTSFGFSGQPTIQVAMKSGGRIWVGTSAGVAYAAESAPDLAGPAPWTVASSFGGNASVNAVSVLRDTVYVGTPGGVFFFTGSGFTPVTSMSGRAVIALQRIGAQLCVLSTTGNGFLLESIAGASATPVTVASGSGTTATAMTTNPNGSIWIGSGDKGIAHWSGASWTYEAPNGPNSSQFISLATDPSGVLWAASGTDGGGKGFYRYDPSRPEGSRWKSFTLSSDPQLGTNDYYKVRSGSGGSMWICAWGNGVLRVDGDSIARMYDTRSTPALPSTVPNDLNYPVVGGVSTGRDGTTWLTVRTAIDGNALLQLTSDSTIVPYRNEYNSSDRLFQDVLVDQYGTNWIANAEPNQKSNVFPGLYYFNEAMTVSGTSNTGGWGLLSQSDGLESNIVLCLAQDLDGEIWAGLDLGVVIITDPLYPRSRRTTSFPIREQSVQSIAVDAVNNKWVGTKEGVFQLKSDGSQLLAHYDVLSTGGRLVDNDVRAIAIDQNRGIVYFGTEKGLSSLEIAPVQTRTSMDQLTFAPNPFLVPNDNDVLIEGLTANSIIKVLSVSGAVVAEFPAQGGGRAFWDGKATNGSYVSSGMYFVVAHSGNGTDVASGKLAVVRR